MKIHARDFQVPPGDSVDLKDWPTQVKPAYESDKDYKKLLQAHTAELSTLHSISRSSGDRAIRRGGGGGRKLREQSYVGWVERCAAS